MKAELTFRFPVIIAIDKKGNYSDASEPLIEEVDVRGGAELANYAYARQKELKAELVNFNFVPEYAS